MSSPGSGRSPSAPSATVPIVTRAWYTTTLLQRIAGQFSRTVQQKSLARPICLGWEKRCARRHGENSSSLDVPELGICCEAWVLGANEPQPDPAEPNWGYRVREGLAKYRGWDDGVNHTCPLTPLPEFPLTQCTGSGVLHEKLACFVMSPRRSVGVIPLARFPVWGLLSNDGTDSEKDPGEIVPRLKETDHAWASHASIGIALHQAATSEIISAWMDSSCIMQPRDDCDVFVAQNLADPSSHATSRFVRLHEALSFRLDKLADATSDFPMPQYQNLVDPNAHLEVRAECIVPQSEEEKSASCPAHVGFGSGPAGSWVATDVLVTEQRIGLAEVFAWLSVASQRAGNITSGSSTTAASSRLRLPNVLMRMVRSYLHTGSCIRMARVAAMGPIPGVDFALGSTTKERERKFKAGTQERLGGQLHITLHALFESALPMLARLRRPALLLPGRIQVVAKAQRIHLTPGSESSLSADADAAYQGIWHQDGMREHVVAVVLYYYRVSPELEGGELEFLDRRPARIVWMEGDCTPESYNKEDAERTLEHELPHCKVPVSTGTMVTFSNYQFVHRVLRQGIRKQTASATSGDPISAANTTFSGTAPVPSSSETSSPHGLLSRDFVAFFVMDQRFPLPSSQRADYIAQQVALPHSARLQQRSEYFTAQIQPAGMFGLSNDHVYSTGNGSVATLGWLQGGQADISGDYAPRDPTRRGGMLDRSALPRLQLINRLPPELHRGVSWIIDGDAPEESEPSDAQ